MITNKRNLDLRAPRPIEALVIQTPNTMYYEEKVINGKLMCRYKLDGEWHEIDYDNLLNKYQNLKQRNNKKYQKIHDLEEKLAKLEQLAMDAKNHELFV